METLRRKLSKHFQSSQATSDRTRKNAALRAQDVWQSHNPRLPHVGYKNVAPLARTLLGMQSFAARLVVVFQPQVRDHLLPAKVPQCVLQLHGLNEEIVLRIQPKRGHRRLEVEAQPLLNA